MLRALEVDVHTKSIIAHMLTIWCHVADGPSSEEQLLLICNRFDVLHGHADFIVPFKELIRAINPPMFVRAVVDVPSVVHGDHAQESTGSPLTTTTTSGNGGQNNALPVAAVAPRGTVLASGESTGSSLTAATGDDPNNEDGQSDVALHP